MKKYKKLLLSLLVCAGLVMTFGVRNYVNATTISNGRAVVSLGGTTTNPLHRGQASGTVVRAGGGIRANLRRRTTGETFFHAPNYTTSNVTGQPVTSHTTWRTGNGLDVDGGWTWR